jgi:hypothetical protein
MKYSLFSVDIINARANGKITIGPKIAFRGKFNGKPHILDQHSFLSTSYISQNSKYGAGSCI